MTHRRKLKRIDKIDAPPPKVKNHGWGSVIQAFNPLGAIAEAYANTLAYRLETKRLTLEAQRVTEQARVMNNAINRQYSLKMEELKQRRLHLERSLDLAEQQLGQLHIERMKVLEMAQLATSRALDIGGHFSLEERRMFKELATELTQQLPHFGSQAGQSLQVLISALPPVEMPQALLEYDD